MGPNLFPHSPRDRTIARRWLTPKENCIISLVTWTRGDEMLRAHLSIGTRAREGCALLQNLCCRLPIRLVSRVSECECRTNLWPWGRLDKSTRCFCRPPSLVCADVCVWPVLGWMRWPRPNHERNLFAMNWRRFDFLGEWERDERAISAAFIWPAGVRCERGCRMFDGNGAANSIHLTCKSIKLDFILISVC